MTVKKASITLFLTLAFIALSATKVIAAETIVVPTTATINKGKLIDEYPGPYSGSTDVELPFYGKISSGHPACRNWRAYEIGRVEPDSEFSPLGRTTVQESGRWRFGLLGKVSRPSAIAIRVLPRDTTYRGTSYRCEETVSKTVTNDGADYTPCKLARAAKRGYAPAIRSTRRVVRRAEARNDQTTARFYRGQLRKFRTYRRSIWRAARIRC